jgi:hypothetical protein
MSGSLIRSLGSVFIQGKLVLLHAMETCKGSECMAPACMWLVYVNINTVMCICV